MAKTAMPKAMRRMASTTGMYAGPGRRSEPRGKARLCQIVTKPKSTSVAPAKTPPHIVKILRDATRQAVKEPEVVTSHAKLDTPIAYMDADEFNAWWAKDAARLAEVVKKIGKVESAQ